MSRPPDRLLEQEVLVTLPGRILITLVALWSAFGSYLFDWNATHIYNPAWPPHAKFHNAQTMLLGTCVGLLALALLWLQKGGDARRVGGAIVLSSLYWLTQAGAALFPGTALIDPQFAHPGQLPVQLIVDAVMLGMLALAIVLERKTLQRS